MDNMNAVEELKYIKNVIDESKRNFIDNGLGYIIWGILVVLGFINTFASVKLSFSFPNTETWIVLISCGWIYMIYKEIKFKSKRKGMHTFAGKILRSLWFGTGITMTILGFIGAMSRAYNGISVIAITAAILAIPYLVTGVIYDFKVLKYSTIAWWAGSIYMFLYPSIYSILIMVLLMIFLQIVPGIYLYKKYKAQMQEN